MVPRWKQPIRSSADHASSEEHAMSAEGNPTTLRVLRCGLSALALGATLVGCGGGGGGFGGYQTTRVLRGSVEVTMRADDVANISSVTKACGGDGLPLCNSPEAMARVACPENMTLAGDVREGTTVTIRDAGNKTIGTARLVDGHLDQLTSCAFTYEAELPKTDSYSVAIEGMKGDTTYGWSDLEAKDWYVERKSE